MNLQVGDTIRLQDILLSTFLQLNGDTQEVYRNYFNHIGVIHEISDQYAAVSFVNEIVQIETQFLDLYSKAKETFTFSEIS